MKKFKVKLERTYEYIIELDEAQMTNEWMDDWREVFYDFYSLDEHAEHIAQSIARFGKGFIEGYGQPKFNGKRPYWLGENEQVNDAINVKVIEEGDISFIDVDEIK